MWKMRERRGKRGAPNMVAGRMGLLLTAKGKSGQAGWGHKRWLWFRTCWVWDAHSSSRLTSQDVNLKLKTTGQARITHLTVICRERLSETLGGVRALREGVGREEKRPTTEQGEGGVQTVGGWQEDSKSEKQTAKGKPDLPCHRN